MSGNEVTNACRSLLKDKSKYNSFVAIVMPDCIFAIPVENIADRIADYWTCSDLKHEKLDSHDCDYPTRYAELYAENFQNALEDSEVLDWLHNNMHWSEIIEEAIKLPKVPEPFNYEDIFARQEAVTDVKSVDEMCKEADTEAIIGTSTSH